MEELVKLGHQLEKDYEQQLQYESSLHHKQQSMSSQAPVIQQMDKIPVQCWRCKGHHPPGNCPGYASSSKQTFHQPQQSQSKRPHQGPKNGGPPSNNAVSATNTAPMSKTNPVSDNSQCSVPQQLVVPNHGPQGLSI